MAQAGRLTTHVLDTMQGRPAAGLRFALSLQHGNHGHRLLGGTTNADGRTDAPLLAGDDFALGDYELLFDVGGYFAGLGVASPFLGLVPLRFTIGEIGHYHVPLLVSPFAYSTYRGS